VTKRKNIKRNIINYLEKESIVLYKEKEIEITKPIKTSQEGDESEKKKILHKRKIRLTNQ
jgi:hypothetical protein